MAKTCKDKNFRGCTDRIIAICRKHLLTDLVIRRKTIAVIAKGNRYSSCSSFMFCIKNIRGENICRYQQNCKN